MIGVVSLLLPSLIVYFAIGTLLLFVAVLLMLIDMHVRPVACCKLYRLFYTVFLHAILLLAMIYFRRLGCL